MHSYDVNALLMYGRFGGTRPAGDPVALSVALSGPSPAPAASEATVTLQVNPAAPAGPGQHPCGQRARAGALG